MSTFETMNPEEKPREKCRRYGVKSLTDQELLAILLRTGTRDKSVLELSDEILHINPLYDGLVGLAHVSEAEYRQIPGVGSIRAMELCAIGEISARIWKRRRRVSEINFRDPDSVAGYLKEDMRHLEYETVHILYLDNHKRLIRDFTVSRGTCSQTALSPREIFAEGIRICAVCMIMAHNHPSGDPEPSDEDVHFTRDLELAGRMVGIHLIDHIIIGDNRYYSFRKQGLI